MNNMNETSGLNRPKKKLKQTSIRDFITIMTKSDNNLIKMNENNHLIDDQLPTTSNSMPMDCTTSFEDNCQKSCASNQKLDMDLTEVPETPEKVLLSDDDFELCEETAEQKDLFEEELELEVERQSINELNRMPKCCQPMPPLKANSTHFILFRLPLSPRMESIPKPYPNSYSDKWDAKHVKMPNSSHNEITAVERVEGQTVKTRVSKWELIEENLCSDIKCCQQLVEAIKTYNPFADNYNFDSLHSFFNHNSSPEERIHFFDSILPEMIRMTLCLPEIVTQSVPLLRQRQNATLFLSQLQIASLLANAFFCTFPKRSHPNEEFKHFPNINFFGLFSHNSRIKIEKLKCIVNYFRRVIKDKPKGIVSFERKCLTNEELPVWHNSNQKLRKLVVVKNGLIEEEGNGLLQVDFANKFIGGGVLGSGSVQEEIRFCICPELIISRLFTESLLNNEVLIMSGCEQFNAYSGYANTFEWTQDYVDNTGYDEWGRRYTRIVAIDALHFKWNETDIQYESKYFERELNKAFVGFVQRRTSDPKHKCAIASGNWGCGAFNGDPLLKAMIQLMAASEADRDLVLFTFNDSNLKKQFQDFYQFVSKHCFKVRHLYKALKLFQQNRRIATKSIFEFIYDNRVSIQDLI